MKLSDFQALSFDCYGTLIDWETGLFSALQPLLRRIGRQIPRDTVLETFARIESEQQRLLPTMPYGGLLAEVHGKLAAEWGVAADAYEDAVFGGSVGDWPAFPDTVEALQYLKQHFKLIILSNVDRFSFSLTAKRLEVPFDAVYTAQDIGSYKPDPRNFTYLLDHLPELGLRREQLLHVAQSLFHDHVPANKIGLPSAWIDRRGPAAGSGATAPVEDGVRTEFRFSTLAAFVEAHRAGN
jgi:2-haloacid dehalogenase